MPEKKIKKEYTREIRQIIANFSIKSASTCFRKKSNSTINNPVYDMIKWNWIECTDENNQFIFVQPTEAFLSNHRIIL